MLMIIGGSSVTGGANRGFKGWFKVVYTALIQASTCTVTPLALRLSFQRQVFVFCSPKGYSVTLSCALTAVTVGSLKQEGKACVWTKWPFPACLQSSPCSVTRVWEENGLVGSGWEAEAGLTLSISASHLSSVIATGANTHLVAKVSQG